MATTESTSLMDDILPWVQVMAAIVAPLLIAWATTRSARVATSQAHDLDRARREEAEKAEVESVLWGIHTELVTLIEHYKEAAGDELEAKIHAEQFYQGHLFSGQSYFTVYENSAEALGRLDDAELLAEIVKTYTYLRALVDAHILQHQLVTTPKGERGESWRKELKARQKRLLELHHQVIKMTKDTVDLLKIRHGPLRKGADEEFTFKIGSP